MKGFERVQGRREMSVRLLIGLALGVAALLVASAHRGSAAVAAGSSAASELTRDPRPAPTPLFREPERNFGDGPTSPTPAPGPPPPAVPAASGVLALSGAAPSAPPSHPYPGHPLRLGSHGPAVREIQQALGITVDGWFGSQTEDAVREFQEAHGLEVDGVVGPITWNALFG